ncbi:TusE/DsrC/DsvC family sulfur relay protein [Thiohalobacter sp.]|uniref:TusE/DsrC/DsvC family sulfur relay protein n=1 Tax=Thiohalobacter sp. TaxID=2025948 RepID=UPI00262825E3|nr:TusE/DsrC/DsvC family sulfur relay protein [Thiohalobacter sp.]
MSLNDLEIARDNEGFLIDPADWSPQVAERLAEELGLEMTPERWEIVELVREHFESHQVVPEARMILKRLRERHGKARATRRYIYSLFPWGYGQQACKIAGMRKPLKLMLDV